MDGIGKGKRMKILKKLSCLKLSTWMEFQAFAWFLIFFYRAVTVAVLASNGMTFTGNAISAAFCLVMAIMNIYGSSSEREE